MSITIGPWSDPMAGRARRRGGARRVAVTVALIAAVVLGAERPARAQVQGSPYGAEQPQDAGPSQEADTAGPAADRDPSALAEFRAPLAPYGRWVSDPTYGTIWIPSPAVVGADFVPYRTAGHWALDEDGAWMWVSDYSWGWAPFHYGRWVLVPDIGWAWIPGRLYAPAWVTWSVGEPGVDYVGWAPMAPDFYWWDGVAFDFALGLVLPVPLFYCPSVYVFDRDVNRFIVRNPAHASFVARHSVEIGRERGRWAPVSPTIEQAHVSAGLAARAHARSDRRALKASQAGRSTARRYSRSLGNVHPLDSARTALPSGRASVEAGTARGPARADWSGSREQRFREAHTVLPAARSPARPANLAGYSSYRPERAMSLSRSPAASRPSRSTMPALRSLHRGGGWRGRYR